ncbi:DUF3108 domain-containing protein [Mucilaginibacter sp. RS28]|uniref:DUF3108 domain-containing protein n=1 Tax=Mucilaginibacter straminoryzae TaxID=2932774 RepID=A0A9X1X550_9SPHI|nr:DUF3108 domain-containing protein [Mucilaginibacter straminoryzae]MCJ8210741.1 DUF3108 domain-containing protein [Mucilaginibacter straminoryzae]
MTKRAFIILFSIVTAAALFAFRQFLPMPDRIDDTAFKAGERLNYRLKYGIFTAAEAHLKIEDSDVKFDGRPAYHIIADGNTAGTFDVFYKVRNRYESYIDKSTLLPYLYTENRHEGSWHHTDKVSFDRQDNKVTAGQGVFPLKGGKVFDFPSAYYFARNLDVSKLKVGDTFDMQYFLDDGVQTLSITFAGREKVKTALGTFNCLKFNPSIIPGRIFRKNSKLYLWVTDDNNRIPVKAHVEVVVGSLTMELTNATGLKFPLNGQLKN